MPIRRPRDADAGADPLDAAQADRVRAVLALGGVPQDDLQDGLQQVRLRLVERRARGEEPPRDVGARAVVVASNLAVDRHRTRHRQERVSERLTRLSAPDDRVQDGTENSLQPLAVAEGLIACSDAVVEGMVERVEPAGGDDRYRIVLDVDRHYKPAGGGRHLAFTDEGADVPAYYRTGTRMLVLVPGVAGEGPESYREGDAPTPEHGLGPAVRDALQEGRLRVERALPGARGLTCDGAG